MTSCHAAQHSDTGARLRLTLVRHGQTACSAADVYCGRHCDPSLTAVGQKTAQSLSEDLGGVLWDGLYVSPLVRAQQTIRPLAQAAGLEPILVPGLSELDYGDWDGARKEDLMARVPAAFAAWQQTPSRIAPPGGETVAMLWRRVQRELARIVDIHNKPTPDGAPRARVLVVSHKSTLRVALCGLLGLDLDQFRAHFDWPLGARAEIDFTQAGPRLVSLGDSRYPKPAAPRAPDCT